MSTAPAVMSRQDWTVLLVLSALWGGSFLFIKIAVETVPPLTFVLLRVAIAASALWLYFLARGQRLPLPPGALQAFLILAVLNNVLPFILFAWAQKSMTIGLGSILNAMTPIWGVVVAHVWTQDEKMTPTKVMGVLLGFGGVAVLLGVDLLGEIGTGLWAQLATLAATLSYALAGVYGRRFRGMGINPVAVTTGQLTAASLIMLPLVLLFEPPWQTAAPSPGTWGAIVALALVGTAVGYILYFRLIASAGATNALLVTFLVPISAILLGAVFLGEVLEPRHIAGMALIGAGLAAIDGRLLRRLRPAVALP